MNFEMAVGKGLTGAVVADGKPRIQNFDDGNKLAVQVPGTTEQEESLLSMPMVTKDTVIGALTLYKIGRRRFEEDDLKSLTVFASQAAAIIETSRLYMQLKASERLYRYSVDLAGDAILFVDFENGKIGDANEMACKLFKYSKAELISMRIWELNPEDQMHTVKRLWEEARQTGWGKLGEVDYISKDSQKLPATVTVSVIRTSEMNSIQWMVRDISEYKRSLEKVGFFHQVFERLDEPILLTNYKGKILFSNKSFNQHFGLDRDRLMKCDVASISLEGSALDVLTPCWMKLRSREYVVDEICIESRSQRAVRKTVSILPHRNSSGDIKYYVWFFHSPMEKSPEGQVQGAPTA